MRNRPAARCCEQLASIDAPLANDTVTFAYDQLGLAAPQRLDFGYDNADQLKTAPLKNASTNALIKQYTYSYDDAANRTSELAGTATTTSIPNNVNEITGQTGATTRTLSYDLNGSTTSDGSTRTFEWDAANRLVAINYTGQTTRSEFSYDGRSRIAKIVEKTGATINSTRKFVWCGTEMVEFRDATDAVTQRNYKQGQYVGTTAYFYTRDHLGSVREMFSGGGTVVARYDYDPYGRSTTILGTMPTDFNFTGFYRHSKSNLDLAMYRAYDPDLARWLRRDPIGESGGLNLYGYVQNNPISQVDPLGLSTEYWTDEKGPDRSEHFTTASVLWHKWDSGNPPATLIWSKPCGKDTLVDIDLRRRPTPGSTAHIKDADAVMWVESRYALLPWHSGRDAIAATSARFLCRRTCL